jgi:hypothetical protein
MRLVEQLNDQIPVLLLGGLGLMIFAAFCAITGEAPVRYKGWAYRDQEPKRFWRRVLIYFAVGLVLLSVGLYLYLTLDAMKA